MPLPDPPPAAGEIAAVYGPDEGPALLLVHGWGGDAAEWGPHARAWAEHGRRVLVPELRGHGRTPPGPGGWSPRDFAADLAALIRRSHAGPVTAVGHSMGGQIVTALAVEHPALVAALVVLDPAYGADAEEMRRLPDEQRALRSRGTPWAVDFLHGAFSAHTPPGVRTRHLRLMAAMDPEILAACRDGMYLTQDAFGSRKAARRYLAHRRCPVLTVCSQPSAAHWLRSLPHHPQSHTALWPTCGHYLHEEHPDALTTLVTTWAAQLTPP
ncbi:alpha/beta hydrolase [Streptomyces sp. N2-109]|uniref:Alpha/beta hydrolase n=1 Tax=Streptomyces gossypii TaxID=2883101 RepID=A0ABT2JY95_9ACTN|nr:alpha/beta hydrolase [Streptomyces gossypii]MCT2592862.1 alpha/beta hydrolase [Streptomyces gossypii]